MNKTISVDCTTSKDGRVRIRRIKLDDEWLVVEQGRQWQDELGRHILIMHLNGHVDEILLSSHSLCWELVPRRRSTNLV